MPAPSKNKQVKNPRRWFSFKGVLIVLTALFVFYYLFQPSTEAIQETNWQNAATLLQRTAIERIEVAEKERALFYVKPGFADSTGIKEVVKPGNRKTMLPGPHFSLRIGSVESFEQNLADIQKTLPAAQRIYPVYLPAKGRMWDLASLLLPLLLFFLFWRYIFIKGREETSSMFGFGKSTASAADEETKSRFTFDDVAGLEEAEQEVKEIVDFLKNPERFTKLGARIPKGVILVGPPGTGKTLLAKAVAGEADVPFFSMSGSEFVEMFVGVGASRVRDLFRRAKENTPSIVFIDEIDAVGRSRGKSAFYTGSNDERESTLNQLLKEMDGFESNSGVVVLAATNRADMLDPALLRPGRFDRHIYLELPNKKEREAIFRVHLRPLQVQANIDVSLLASQTPGFSGADIANVCNEAALIAARTNKEKVGAEEFFNAIDRVVAGMERKTKMINPAEKKRIAYHEAGHAVVSWLMPHVDPLIKISIIPRGKTLGAAWYLPEEKQLRTKTEFNEHLCATLGGRAAEDIVFGEPTSGALDDLEKVTHEAYMMVAFLGFNEQVGTLSFYDSTGQRDTGFVKPYSEATGQLIDEQVRKLVNEAYEHTKVLLQQHKKLLDKLATQLLEKEILYKEDLEKILGKRTTDPVIV